MAKYRAGVVGCTGIGNRHTTGFADLPDVKLVAACDIVPEVLDQFVEKWESKWENIAKYTEHQEMLKDERLDIVTVATSDHQHADIVVDSANAGVRGIFCEKPMATSLVDADRMVEACEKNNTILSIDHTRRWYPLYRKTRELIREGVIDNVQYIIGTLGGHRAMLFRNGTHLIDAICFFAESSPEWVTAELETGYEDYWEYRGDGGHDPKTEPAATGCIHYENGVRAFYCGLKETPGGFRLEIVGSDGYILISDQKAEIYSGDSCEEIQPERWQKIGIPAGIEELVQLLESGDEPISPGKEAHKTVEIIIGFLESQRRDNAKVTIPVPRDRLK